jgi:hypothetical protein
MHAPFSDPDVPGTPTFSDSCRGSCEFISHCHGAREPSEDVMIVENELYMRLYARRRGTLYRHLENPIRGDCYQVFRHRRRIR